MKYQKKQAGKSIQTANKNKITGRTEIQQSKVKVIIWIFVIIAACLVFYSPSFKNGITNWDDDQYVIKNPWLKEISGDNIKSIFSNYYMGNYHPLAMLSLSVDYQIGGEDKKGEIKPWIYHLTNVILHIINTLLVFWLVWMLFSRFEIAVISALLFGLSTLHVESVAWISERKDVIYALFFIASLVAWVYYVKHRKIKYYVFSLVLFILSLFSKGQAVSLAVTLFAIDYLFERKLLEKKVILEKIPFLLLALIFGIVAIKAQQAGNAMADTDSYELYKRIGFAGYAFTQYLIKLLVPLNLSAIYPYPDIINKAIPAYYWLFMVPVIFVIYLFFYYLKSSRAIAFCIAFFIINIFLLLQLIPVGSAIWADRYSYIPSIGYYTLAGWLVYQLILKYKSSKGITYGIVGIYLIVIGIASFQRCKVWENSLGLWDDTLEKSPKAVVAWNNRGSIKDKDKKHDEAIADFSEAIRLKPDYTHAFYNRGTAKRSLAEQTSDTILINSAIDDFNFAIKLNHVFVEAYHNRGLAKETKSGFSKSEQERNAALLSALEDYNKTVELNPNYENALVNRGVLKGKLNRFDEAIADFNQAIANKPGNAEAYANRGLAKDYKEDFNGALADYNKAIELKPDFEKAYYNRGITYRKMQKYDLSTEDFTQAIRLDPNMGDAYYYRGVNRVLMDQKDLACKDFQFAIKFGNPYAKGQYDLYCNK